MATPTAPSRNGRPCVSLMMTPTRAPSASAIACRIASAEASGFLGSIATHCGPRPTLLWSTPAFAQMNPSRCSAMINPGRTRSTARDSFKITWHSRGSFFASSASCNARGPGVTSSRLTTLPSALETTFCATTRISKSSGATSLKRKISRIRRDRSSPGRTSGKPTGTQTVSVRMPNYESRARGVGIRKLRRNKKYTNFLLRPTGRRTLFLCILMPDPGSLIPPSSSIKACDLDPQIPPPVSPVDRQEQTGQLLQDAGLDQRTHIDRSHPDRAHQPGDDLLRVLVIAAQQDVAVWRSGQIGQHRCAHGVKTSDDTGPGEHPARLFCRRIGLRSPRGRIREGYRRIDDDLPGRRIRNPSQNLRVGIVWNGDDDHRS